MRNLAAFAFEHDAAQATHPLAVTSVGKAVLHCQCLGASLKQQPPPTSQFQQPTTNNDTTGIVPATMTIVCPTNLSFQTPTNLIAT